MRSHHGVGLCATSTQVCTITKSVCFNWWVILSVFVRGAYRRKSLSAAASIQCNLFQIQTHRPATAKDLSVTEPSPIYSQQHDDTRNCVKRRGEKGPGPTMSGAPRTTKTNCLIPLNYTIKANGPPNAMGSFGTIEWPRAMNWISTWLTDFFYDKNIITSIGALWGKAQWCRPTPRDYRPRDRALGLDLEGPGLGFGLESCFDNYTSWRSKIINWWQL